MASLKQEMQQMFDKRSSMAFYENNSKFEEGLLEQIINLAFANLQAFSNEYWKIIAVKSPVLLQKLYSITGEKEITESAFTLIICKNEPGEYNQNDLNLLFLSINYAAKFYCINFHIVRDFNKSAVARDFLSIQLKPAAIICLGFFRDPVSLHKRPTVNLYSDIIKII